MTVLLSLSFGPPTGKTCLGREATTETKKKKLTLDAIIVSPLEHALARDLERAGFYVHAFTPKAEKKKKVPKARAPKASNHGSKYTSTDAWLQQGVGNSYATAPLCSPALATTRHTALSRTNSPNRNKRKRECVSTKNPELYREILDISVSSSPC